MPRTEREPSGFMDRGVEAVALMIKALLMNLKILPLAAAGAFLCVASPSPSRADPIRISADLTPSAEVPEVKSGGKGALTGTYDPDTKQLSFTVTYKGLTGPATMAHFHGPAPTGKNAPIAVPIKGSVASPIQGDVTLTAQQGKDLLEGMTYFNVHTKANAGGEIRGQILTVK